MFSLKCLCLLATASFLPLVSAHTQIWYPEWRNNSFNPPFSQAIYPCAGISDTLSTKRTLWPLDGGSLNVTLHDSAAYIFINLGLGVNSTNFNITLFAQPLNETGRGNLCFPKLTLPSGLKVEEGMQASIQFATVGSNGEGLYNCADITFSSKASLLPTDQCMNSSTVSITPFSIGNAEKMSPSSAGSSTSAPPSPSTSGKVSGATDFTPSVALLLAGLFAAVL